jgi:hypothetical protein
MQQNANADVQNQQKNQAVCRKKMAVLARCLFVNFFLLIPCKRHPDLNAEHNASQLTYFQTPFLSWTAGSQTLNEV